MENTGVVDVVVMGWGFCSSMDNRLISIWIIYFSVIRGGKAVLIKIVFTEHGKERMKQRNINHFSLLRLLHSLPFKPLDEAVRYNIPNTMLYVVYQDFEIMNQMIRRVVTISPKSRRTPEIKIKKDNTELRLDKSKVSRKEKQMKDWNYR